MKTFKLNTQILIIYCGLIATGASAPQKHIGADGREYLIDNDEYDWFGARDECARHNRQLLTIESLQKQDVVNELLKVLKSEMLLWLGGRNSDPSGNVDRTFFWSTTGNPFTYANWGEKNLETFYSKQKCVLIDPVSNKWIKESCGANYYGLICEEKQLLAPSTKNPNNASDIMQQFIKDFELKFLSLLKDNMAQLNGRLENIEQVSNDTKYEVNKLTNITQTAVEKILNKQELSSKESNHEITKQVNVLNDQLKRYADELNEKFSDKQNFTSPPKNIVVINQNC